MRITWYGHAAFLIETNGTRVIVDPFRSPDSGGYAPINEPADLVIVSHENDRYHSHLGQIIPPFAIVRALELPPEGIETHGLKIVAHHVFENDQKLPEDEVTMFQLTIEGVRILFLGDLGHTLTEDEVTPILGADIVLAAAGGAPTIALPDLADLLHTIKPKIIVPMHYKNEKINLSIFPVDRFFESMPDLPIEHVHGSSLDITRETLPTSTKIVSLQPAR